MLSDEMSNDGKAQDSQIITLTIRLIMQGKVRTRIYFASFLPIKRISHPK
jgi:hypothetical protein